MAEPLFLFEGENVEAARSAHGRGERVISFSESAASRLASSSVPFTRSVTSLGDDPEMPLYRASADWTRSFGTEAIDAAGQTLKEALSFRETTLWWWAELSLHHNSAAARRVRFLETVARVVEASGPGAVGAHGLSGDETVLVQRFCASRGLGFTRGEAAAATDHQRRSARFGGLVQASKIVATAIRGVGRHIDRLAPQSVTFISHAAFWKSRPAKAGGEERYEHYLDSLLTAARERGLPVVVLGVGPRSSFRTRSTSEKWMERLSRHRNDPFVHINRFVTPKVAASALRAFGNALTVHNRFRNAASLRTAFSHRGVPFADFSGHDLGHTLLRQVPWAARCLLEFEAAFRELDPRLVCLYAESSGLGRAVIEAARRSRVKSLGVQHGILYPNYFSYERTATDVALGTPIADVTAVYGDDGVRLLETAFRYPKGRVVATGSPRYDAQAAEIRALSRNERRKSLGVTSSERVVVLASRYRGILDTHKAAGPAFAGLLKAVNSIEGARLLVKPHPAEPADAYDQEIAAAGPGTPARVITDRPLSDLLAAADLLVTVESLSATEALVAGVPVVVLRHPSNLRDMVTCGAAAGVAEGEDPRPCIENLLTDTAVRARWQEARSAFLMNAAHGVDGRALDRLIGLVSRMAGLD